MTLRELADKLIRRQGSPSVGIRIPNDKVFDSSTSPLAAFAPGQSYLEVRLAWMHLRNAREVWRSFLPLASVLTEVSSDGGGREPVPYLVGPSQLAGSLQSDVGPVTIENKPVAGPLPYLGGDVRLLAVLYRTAYEDWAERALGIVELIAKQVDVSRLSSALPIGRVVVDALEGFLGMQKVELRLGFDRTLSLDGAADGDNTLKPGWFAFFGPGQPPAREFLSVRGDRLYYLANDNREYEYVESDYLLLHVKAIQQRTDYTRLDFESVQWRKVQDLLWAHQYDAAEAAFSGAFTASLMQCVDLTRSQRIALFEKYERDFLEDRQRAEQVRVGTAKLDSVTGPRESTESELAVAATAAVDRPDLTTLLDAFS